MIDCGEATQIQLKRFKIRFNRIKHIFISHLHGDHYLGLLGLISSMHLEGRSNELHIYGSPGLEEIINLQLKYSETTLKYPLIFHPLQAETSELILDNTNLIVYSVPLDHRIPCNGFLFQEKERKRKILREKIEQYAVPVTYMEALKNGDDYKEENGRIIPNEELTTDAPTPRAFAYCSDTAYEEKIIPLIKGVDLLYHETTFMHDLVERAKETYHSTTIQAGTIANKAGVKKLIIGHFSARYGSLQPLLEETKSVFPNTILAIEGESYQIEEKVNTGNLTQKVTPG
ncbi:ribonuclease Z [Candidatus Amoebophilus asiaticus]|nr:ribonuclease Z [Candidatus Amoebophilus asiaticus]